MPGLKIDHTKCTECRMCYVACREININAVVVSPTSQHLLEIDERCTYPQCTVCLDGRSEMAAAPLNYARKGSNDLNNLIGVSNGAYS